MTSTGFPPAPQPDLTTPRYRSIAVGLRHRILAGDVAVGEAIPPEHELARQHGVCRMTARHAVTLLVDRGLLRREQGRGTFVTQRKIVRALSSVSGLFEDLAREVLAPGGQVLSLQRKPGTPEESTRLDIPRGRDVWHLVRSRTADNVPIALQVVVIPVEVVPVLDTIDLQRGSLYGQLRERGLPLTFARQRIEAINAAEVALQLGVPAETAFLRVTRVSRAPDHRPVELLVS